MIFKREKFLDRDGLDYYHDKAKSSANGFVIEDISVNKYLDDATNTHYWIVHIPHLDKDGNLIRLKHGLARDVDDSSIKADETTRSFAKRTGATIAVNASIFGTNSGNVNYMRPVGTIIKDGKLVSNYDKAGFSSSPVNILGVKEDNTLKVYPYGTSYEDLIADGVVNSFGAFDQVIVNGVITGTFANYNYQWNLIGQNSETKDIYLFVCNGKDMYGEKGMTLPNACQKLADVGCDFAFRLDQGGSTTLCQNGSILNQVTDDIGTSDRNVPDYIYFGNDVKNDLEKSILDAFEAISDTNYELNLVKQSSEYPHDIYSNEIRFVNPSPISTSTGARISLRKNVGTDSEYNDCSIVLSPNGAEKTFNIWDNQASKTIVRIDGLNEKIALNGKTLSTILDQTPDGGSTTDLDNLPFHTGIVRLNASYNLTHSPYTTSDCAYYYVVQLCMSAAGYNQRIQIAFPQIKRDELNDAIVVRGFTTSWGNWRYMNQTQAVSTANRPTKFLRNGMMIFDTTLGKPIWYNNGNWYDATGTQV